MIFLFELTALTKMSSLFSDGRRHSICPHVDAVVRSGEIGVGLMGGGIGGGMDG